MITVNYEILLKQVHLKDFGAEDIFCWTVTSFNGEIVYDW